jgi:hypothetical protein
MKIRANIVEKLKEAGERKEKRKEKEIGTG